MGTWNPFSNRELSAALRELTNCLGDTAGLYRPAIRRLHGDQMTRGLACVAVRMLHGAADGGRGVACEQVVDGDELVALGRSARSPRSGLRPRDDAAAGLAVVRPFGPRGHRTFGTGWTHRAVPSNASRRDSRRYRPGGGVSNDQ